MSDIPAWFILPFLFVVGTVIGSFLNVCIYRIPQHETLFAQLKALTWPSSHCPQCKRSISRSDNVPVLGWVKLWGRCRFCKARISPRYPIVEFLNGLLFILVYWFEMPENIRRSIADSCIYAANGPQLFKIWSNAAWLHWRYAYHMVLLEALVVASMIDLDRWEIPDASTVPAMVIGVLAGGLLGQVFLVPVWFQNPRELFYLKTISPAWLKPLLEGPAIPQWILEHPHWHGFAASLAGLIVGGGIVWYVRIIGFWALRREAMGFGDVMLMAAIGSFIGWQPVLVVFFLAPFCAMVFAIASLVMRRGGEIPYGPYLSLATLVLLLFWKRIWPTAERIFQHGAIAMLLLVAVALSLAVCLQMTQLVKRLLGIPVYPQQSETMVIEQWLPSDQLQYLAGENVDDRQGRWKTDRWPGTDSARGLSHQQQWRNGSPGSSRRFLQGRNGRR